MPADPVPVHELQLLEHIEAHPETTQADLAAQLGVAVGTVNWYVNRLIKKGCIKVAQLQRRRLRYLITPGGIAEKSRLAVEYAQYSFQLYRKVRAQALELVGQAMRGGATRIVIHGDGDIAEICRLTCLEQGVAVISESDAVPGTVSLVIDGVTLALHRWPLERPPALGGPEQVRRGTFTHSISSQKGAQ